MLKSLQKFVQATYQEVVGIAKDWLADSIQSLLTVGVHWMEFKI